MNTIRNCRGLAQRLIWLSLVIALFRTASAAPNDAREEKFKVLQTRTRSYTNVTVTTRSDAYIFIVHAGGMENVQVSDLPADVLKKLGYTVNENSQAKVSLAPTRVMARSPDAGASTLKSGGMSAKRPVWLTKLASQMVLVVLTVCLAIWLFYCFCLMLICKKAGSEPGLLIWVPYLQIIPMVRAAGMESSWLWLFYAPWVGGFFLRLPGNGTPHSPITVLAVGVTCLLVQFIAWVVWCFRIVKAREKSPLVALLLLSPIACIIAFFIPDSMMVFRGCFALSTLVLSFGAFLYLAFSSAASPEQPTKKYESMALEVA